MFNLQGKQGKMKELYQQAVADSERVTKINAVEEIQHTSNARSIKEKFERGEPIATSDDENESKLKQEKPDEEVIAAGLFLVHFNSPNSCKSSCEITFSFYKIFSWKFEKYNRS